MSKLLIKLLIFGCILLCWVFVSYRVIF
jgi:hypothetical protein